MRSFVKMELLLLCMFIKENTYIALSGRFYNDYVFV